MMQDPYMIPGTQTLKNKCGILNKDKLAQKERLVSALRMIQLQTRPPSNKPFDFDRLKSIHHALFSDLYTWAGKTRTVNIAKGEMFCPTQNLNEFAKDVFRNFESECRAAKTKQDFADRLAEHYGDMNALHPFREGNGRTQREFARELSESCGFILDLRKIDAQEMLNASRESLYGFYDNMARIFEQSLFTPEEYAKLEQSEEHPCLALTKGAVSKPVRQFMVRSAIPTQYEPQIQDDDQMSL